MPPTRRANTKKVTEAAAGLADFLKFAGVEVDAKEVADAFDMSPYLPREHQDVPMLQAEGVLLYAQNAARNFMPKICKHCKQAFSTNYVSVAYCSSLCRGKAMESVGMKWDYTKDHYQLMGVERPIVVGPEAYSTLLEMAHRILDNHMILMEEVPQNPEVESLEAEWLEYPEVPKYSGAPDTTPAPSPPQSSPPLLGAQLPRAPF